MNKDVCIDGGITLPKINYALKKLIQNDADIGGQQTRPAIWECSWYNADKNSLSSYGYSVGDAVWINTERLEDFVEARETEIRNYALQNPKTCYKVRQLSSDTDRAELLQLYKDIVNGENGYDRLYYLGDISADAQIRVSLSSGNTELPTSDTHWADFIRRDLTKEYYEASILSSLDCSISSQFAEHVNKYHMGGVLGSKTGVNVSEYLSKFLRLDMSNLETGHKMLNHVYSHDMDGFDYVVDSGYTDYNNGMMKWYRVWNSGMVEQGGIVDTENVEATGDELVYGGDFCRIVLPVPYDYPTLKVGSFYQRDQKIDAKNDSGQFGYANGPGALDYEYRYQIHITRNPSAQDPAPYSMRNEESDDQCYYEVTDVTNIDNASFVFNVGRGGAFSYETRGFKVS